MLRMGAKGRKARSRGRWQKWQHKEASTPENWAAVIAKETAVAPVRSASIGDRLVT